MDLRHDDYNLSKDIACLDIRTSRDKSHTVIVFF